MTRFWLAATVIPWITVFALATRPDFGQFVLLFVLVGFFLFPLLCLFGVAPLILASSMSGQSFSDLRHQYKIPGKMFWAKSCLAYCLLAILLYFHLPLRLMFWVSYIPFSQQVENSLKYDAQQDPICINKYIGSYHVECYQTDQRGGIYYRTATGPDGIGPDQMSYGFAYRPNSEGTPFGNSRMTLVPLSSDWYAFAVSDD